MLSSDMMHSVLSLDDGFPDSYNVFLFCCLFLYLFLCRVDVSKLFGSFITISIFWGAIINQIYVYLFIKYIPMLPALANNSIIIYFQDEVH